MTQSRYHCHTEKDAQDLVTSPSDRNSHIFSRNLPGAEKDDTIVPRVAVGTD